MTTCICGHPKDSHAKLGGCAAKSIPQAHQTSRARWACECERFETGMPCVCKSRVASGRHGEPMVCDTCGGTVEQEPAKKLHPRSYRCDCPEPTGNPGPSVAGFYYCSTCGGHVK